MRLLVVGKNLISQVFGLCTYFITNGNFWLFYFTIAICLAKIAKKSNEMK